jgi:hypothetical protein
MDRGVQESSCLALGNILCIGNCAAAAMAATANHASRNLPIARNNNSDAGTNSTYSCPAAMKAIEEANGVHRIILAMKNHPQSVAVQSAACDALRNMSSFLFTNFTNDSTATDDNNSNVIATNANATSTLTTQTSYNNIYNNNTSDDMEVDTPSVQSDLIQALLHAREMYLHPTHKLIVENLLSALLDVR